MVMLITDIREKSTVSEQMMESTSDNIRSERMEKVFQNWLEKSRQTIVIHKEV
jgi:hypothetical protein